MNSENPFAHILRSSKDSTFSSRRPRRNSSEKHGVALLALPHFDSQSSDLLCELDSVLHAVDRVEIAQLRIDRGDVFFTQEIRESYGVESILK